MSQDRYLTLFEFNWLPALYAHGSRMGVWTDWSNNVLVRRPDSRLTHQVSIDMMASWLPSEAPLNRIPAQVWPLAPNDWVQQLALEVGLAASAQAVRGVMDREAVLRLHSVFGPGVRKRCFDYCDQYAELAAIWPTAEPVGSVDQVVALGGYLLAESVNHDTIDGDLAGAASPGEVVAGVRRRVELRFPVLAYAAQLTPGCLVETRLLTARICDRGASPSVAPDALRLSAGRGQKHRAEAL